jgi:acetylornithine deacetylase/succinyl-diaminopimelate desuccinylase-like protein
VTTRPPNDDPAELLALLVGIDSANPDLSPGGAGEAAIADACSAWLAAEGFEIHRLERHPGRPSIVAVARGTGGGRSLMLNGHLDTVALGDYAGDALRPDVRDGRLYGRGAFDMKGGVAAIMVAAARAVRAARTRSGGLRGDLLVTLVADEEHASFGTAEVLETFTADAAIVCEPTLEDLVVAHKGFAWFEVEVVGVAAHGSRPDLGVDAIAKAGHFLVALEALQEQLASGPAHPLLGTGSVHAGVIRGGEEPSTYPGACVITVERRTVPGEDADMVEGELRAVLHGLVERVPAFAYRLRRGLVRDPWEAAPDAWIPALVARHATAVLGRPVAVRGETYWADAQLLEAAGIPAVMIGVDGGGAHAATEWAEVASVERLARILAGVIEEHCA